MEGAYHMNKFIVFFCMVFLAVLTVSCGKSEKAAIQEAEALVNEINSAKESQEWEKVEQASDRLLQCAEKINRQPEKNRFLIAALETKGIVCFQKRNDKEAFPYFERAYSYYDSIPGKNLFSKIDSVIFLYSLATRLKKEKEAALYWAQAETLINQIQVEARTNSDEAFQKNYKSAVASFLNYKMEAFIEKGEYQEALEVSCKIFQLYGGEEQYQKDTVFSLYTFSILARLYSTIGKYESADRYFEKELTSIQRIKTFPSVSYNLWMKTFFTRKLYKEAESVAKHTLQMISDNEPYNYEDAHVYVNISFAWIYQKCNNRDEAEKYMKEIMVGMKKMTPSGREIIKRNLKEFELYIF